MDTFKIKAIVAAVQHQSLSRAAEEFSYTPSAFSHMTAAFEKELGIQIFRRHSRGVELTEEGKDRCRIMALDDFVSEKNISSVGLLKADVEGMGLELLKGAIGTIRRDRPVLSLAAYHNVDELLGQYAYLSSELENYHFELRDLPPGSSFEVTLLGIPEEILR